MNQLGIRSLATLTISALAFAGIGATAANANTKATAPSFAGTYDTKIMIPGDTRFRDGGDITLNADGTSPAGGKKVAHWSNDGTHLTITLTIRKDVETLTAVQTKKGGLSTKAAPGAVNFDGQPTGLLWYAIKIS